MEPQQQFNKLLENSIEKRKLKGQTYDKNYFNNNFIPLLAIGNYYEKLALKRLLSHYNYKEKPKIILNNDSRYDIKLNKRTFEVKADIKAVQTGNIFIEYMNNNKLSGISITEAKYYLIIIPHEVEIYILIKVRKLKTLIENDQYFKQFLPNKYNNFYHIIVIWENI